MEKLTTITIVIMLMMPQQEKRKMKRMIALILIIPLVITGILDGVIFPRAGVMLPQVKWIS